MASALRATGLLDDFWKVKLYRAAHEQLQILILMDRTLDAGKNHALQGSSSGMLRLKNVCNRSTMFQICTVIFYVRWADFGIHESCAWLSFQGFPLLEASCVFCQLE